MQKNENSLQPDNLQEIAAAQLSNHKWLKDYFRHVAL